MVTMHRRRQRRYHGDRGMQALGGLILVAGTLLCGVLLGLALLDWGSGHDTLATLARGAWR